MALTARSAPLIPYSPVLLEASTLSGTASSCYVKAEADLVEVRLRLSPGSSA
jgi:hypothetical protein